MSIVTRMYTAYVMARMGSTAVGHVWQSLAGLPSNITAAPVRFARNGKGQREGRLPMVGAAWLQQTWGFTIQSFIQRGNGKSSANSGFRLNLSMNDAVSIAISGGKPS